MRRSDSDELLIAVLTGEAPIYHPNTGQPVDESAERNTKGLKELSRGAKIGLEPPRFCQICGRRMIVQVLPMGWVAHCSRHGELDSRALER
ncbi:hypothetical protein CCICO_02985 [Corynebacterium ciconiae DSM 44920]|uniref:biotin synthase auxiliary protein BsaP n=1 Tax=Corynebacterium ciconiae TaxID=227319 RepID=UPI00037FC41D|nr:hypothetical protein [Corynebacterium ciconiae]WKD60642.1 hypothetical protein CCICO_02985 [Corynebacterium ciconiae DSM 44920]